MNQARTGYWPAITAALCAATITASLVAMTPERASTYTDPNGIDVVEIHSYQDALDFAIIKCALGRPDCVGVTNSPFGNVVVNTDGKFFSLIIGQPGAVQIIAEKIPMKSMLRFQRQMSLANAISPVPGPSESDPNEAVSGLRTSDHTFDPNDSQIRITSSLSFKAETSDGQKGVVTVTVSPSLSVEWNLQLK